MTGRHLRSTPVWVNLALGPTAVVFATAPMSVPAEANSRTTLLSVDLKTGKKRRIDARGAADAADRDLDALLDDATGKRFSTTDLEKIERTLRRYLRARRPRGEPRLLLFLYPGRISQGRLKELREVLVDVELVVDPCPRSVCHDAVGRHLELLGRALQQTTLRMGSYAIRFKTVTIRAVSDLRDGGLGEFGFDAQTVVNAAKRGQSRSLVQKAMRQRSGYAQQMTQRVTRQMRARRVRLKRPPRVTRQRDVATVDIELRSDRLRYRGDVTQALAGTMKALQTSSLTPSDVGMTVVAHTGERKGPRRFRCKGYAVALYLKGRLSRAELWSSYVVEQQKGGTRMTFDESDEPEASTSAPDRTEEILSANFQRLAPCLQTEARRNRRFKGVTLRFAIDTGGRATRASVQERHASQSLKACLIRALKRIRFQRHAGPPRQVTYPMYIQR